MNKAEIYFVANLDTRQMDSLNVIIIQNFKKY